MTDRTCITNNIASVRHTTQSKGGKCQICFLKGFRGKKIAPELFIVFLKKEVFTGDKPLFYGVDQCLYREIEAYQLLFLPIPPFFFFFTIMLTGPLAKNR